MYGSYLSSLPMKLPQLARVVRGLFGIHSAAIQMEPSASAAAAE